ncbi:hypothetical protein [Mycolicibacterium psychrotolerans]|uniref:DUF1214 domain-containing protein n=1 Tax=Mycolicibacterium psychrotolerans TaxID=216929 RepID=A0A7I7MFW1_9MYCO|nr:hypothetical protein [Mycolicibacterium psychrotolerans]BBX71221.1 hypothetical protein MPSYJ_46820 [Mycolicibacterium psychrotolerans]
MATTQQLPAQVIGRVGALAVALGIGVAIAHHPGVALADDDTSTAATATSTSTSTSRAADQDGPSGAGTLARPNRDQAGTDSERADVALRPRARLSRTTAGDLPRRPATPDPSPAVWAVAGAARRELGIDPAGSVSPLGTEQQLQAEQVAAETVQTLPVKVMKRVLRKAWLRTAEREYDRVGGVDDENLARLDKAVNEYAMGAAFQQQLLDPMRPTVVAQVAPPHTWYGTEVPGSRILYDNPDTIYRFTAVNKTSTYVLTGRFTGDMPADTTFSVLTGLSGKTSAVLSARDLQIDDGRFTITLSGDPAAPGEGDHLQLTADSTLIAVRNTLSDWNSQPPMELSIERVSGPRDSLFAQLGGFAIPLIGPTVSNSRLLTALVSVIPPMKNPPPFLRGTLTAVVMALGLSREATYIKVATTDPQTGERVAPNVLRDPSRNAEFLATQLQSAGYFDLTDNQALVVTVDPGNAGYFTVPVTDLWTISGDYRNEQTSLNNAQACPNKDGTFTLVISPTDPGVENWVSTGGLNRGTLSLRFQDLDLASPKSPTVRSLVVPLSQLLTALPPGTAVITAADRAAQLARRKAGYDVRFAPFPQ